jgi:hypothetical protein
MRRIYKRASAVHVWLGDEADDSSTAIDMLTTLSTPPRHAPGEEGIQYPSFTEADIARHWNALHHFFRRPWWERVWIRQEIALHRSVLMSCGNKTLGMGHISSALNRVEYLRSLGYEPFIRNENQIQEDGSLSWESHPRKLVGLQNSTDYGYSWLELSDLLVNARGCKATDPRDFVFSILGLADPEIYPIIPNYRDSLRDILITAAGTAVQQRYGLDMFAACQNPKRKYGFPSWVPNVADDWITEPFSLYNQQLGAKSRNSDLSVTEEELPTVRVDGEVLLLKGGLSDAIRLVCEDTIKSGAGAEELEAVYMAWQRFIHEAASRGVVEEYEAREYIKGREEEEEDEEEEEEDKTRPWLRFISVLQDTAEDLDKRWNKRIQNTTNTGPTTSKDPDWALTPYHYPSPYNRLIRSYLLPPTYTPAHVHRNYRIHNALRTNCVGRRLGVTQRGFLALIPAEAEVGDSIAIFQGASMPYVLRKAQSSGDHVLVGEAFVPKYKWGGGEREAKYNGENVNEWIRLC